MLKSLVIIFLLFFSFNSFSTEVQITPSDFLHSAKEHYQSTLLSPQNETIHFVMGNESADLDSIISSIAYAYLLQHENQDQLYVPLLNIYREEIALRKDILYLLQLFQISIDDLLFLDDNVPLDLLFKQNRLRFNLVDHNNLRPRQEHLSSAVERIVDHHADENKHYPLLDSENKTLATVGSAATLVSEKLLASSQITMTPELALMLLGPILIDTSHLQSVEKTTEKDIKAVETLQPLAAGIQPQGFYEKLLEAKNDVSGLTPSMLLSKDFKEYLDGQLLYGISSLPSAICWWIEDASSIHPVLEKYAKEQGLSFLILLMSNKDPSGPKRKIIVYSRSKNLLRAFENYVQTDPVLKEIFLPGPRSDEDSMSFYWTENFTSRKQLQPLLRFCSLLLLAVSI